MWVFTTTGFYSVVQDEDPRFVHIRARCEEDLLRLYPKAPGYPTIIATPEADYPYRVIVMRATWASQVATFAEDIHYKNFKGAVEEKQGKERHDTYFKVWRILHELEDSTVRTLKRFLAQTDQVVTLRTRRPKKGKKR